MKLFKLMVCAMFLFLLSSPAQALDPKGPEGHNFGAGVYLGDPTGFTMKGYLSDHLALDGIVAWSFVEDSFTLIGDVTYDLFALPIDSDDVEIPFYAGAGAKVAFDRDGDDDGETLGALRIPLGLTAQWKDYPVEVFLEASPGIQFAPDTEFDFTGGLGARFYFF